MSMIIYLFSLEKISGLLDISCSYLIELNVVRGGEPSGVWRVCMMHLQKYLRLIVLSCLPYLLLVHGASAEDHGNEYLDMDISQLMQVTITSVSKKEQLLVEAPAAVFVISQEDIRSSGVTSIPEALRMAPGLQVARISSSKWAISSRGMNGNFSNKLLVMIDGRTVYTPGFSGTYWDMQNTLLEDIERIEVVRGPGATMWGANAVNGVINIITKSAENTQGGFVEIGAGNKEKVIGGFRYGAELSSNVKARYYLTYNERDNFTLSKSDKDAYDDWKSLSTGFRVDGQGRDTSWTLQGDAYSNDENQVVQPLYTATPPYVTTDYGEVDAKGSNLLARLEKKISSTGGVKLQGYYNYTDRQEVYVGQNHKTFDLDLQYGDVWADLHNVTMGLGYRNIDTSMDNSFQVSFSPAERSEDLYSGFIQDVITVSPDSVWLTLGTKWEHNDYTGNEFQPTGRIMYRPDDTQSLWASISRAVRTPSQIESSGDITVGVIPYLPPYPYRSNIKGNPDFESEEIIAYEVGYRWYPVNNFSLDITPFYNVYDDVLTVDDRNNFINGLEGEGYGVEVAADYSYSDWLKFVFTYSFLKLEFDPKYEYASEALATVNGGSSPRHQLSLRTNVNFLENWQANIWLRYVDEIKTSSTTALTQEIVVDDYFDLDLNIGWKPRENIEVMLVGQNLLNSSHLEFVSEYFQRPVEVQRSVSLKVSYRF